jgi:hypothetical protein
MAVYSCVYTLVLSSNQQVILCLCVHIIQMDTANRLFGENLLDH